MLVNNYNALLRESGYMEYDETAVNEADMYEIKDDGSWGAVEGNHDDLLMTRMGAFWMAIQYMPIPEIVKLKAKQDSRKRPSVRPSKKAEKSHAKF